MENLQYLENVESDFGWSVQDLQTSFPQALMLSKKGGPVTKFDILTSFTFRSSRTHVSSPNPIQEANPNIV